MFSAGGPDASLEAWRSAPASASARSIATFPTREALFEAVYRREVEQLADLAEQLATRPPRSKRCAAGCAPMSSSSRPRRAWWRRWRSPRIGPRNSTPIRSIRLTKAVGALLDRAVAAGEIRADISAEDLLRALVGMCYNVYDTPDWRKTALRLVDIFVDGLSKR